jgi:coronin-1B/1C/6
VSFIVPRRSETFQEDVYPPTVGLKPAVSSNEWFAGKDGIPPKVSMESLYEGEGMKEVEEEQMPVTKAPEAVKAPEPAKVPEPVQSKAQAKPEPAPVPVREAPPSMKEEGGSMMAMADKFTDHDAGNGDGSDASSFEEVQRPAERSSAVKPASSTVTKDEAVAPASELWEAPEETEEGPGPNVLDKVNRAHRCR